MLIVPSLEGLEGDTPFWLCREGAFQLPLDMATFRNRSGPWQPEGAYFTLAWERGVFNLSHPQKHRHSAWLLRILEE